MNGVRALDFHALHVQDVAVMLDDLVMPVLPVLKKLVIITGHGRHNRRGQAPLQERLANELKYRRIPFERVHCNPGAFLLTSP